MKQINSNKAFRYVFSNSGTSRPYSRDALLFSDRTIDNACVVFDGTKVIYASEAERFTKVRHDFHSPIWALDAFVDSFDSGCEPPMINISSEFVERNHHEHHIYETFYQSGFKESAVLVNDGMGNLDDCITLAYVVENEHPIILKKFSNESSPCMLYDRASGSIFGHANTQGKFMGLAGYGKDNGYKYIWWDDHVEEIRTDIELVLRQIDEVRERSGIEEECVMNSKDIAFTVQKNFEDVLEQVVIYFDRLLKDKDIKTKNLCLSGGGILNCPTNSRIIDLGLFDNYYASPQPSDGCADSIGKAYRNMHARGERLLSSRIKTPYLGRSYSPDRIRFPYEKLKDSFDTIVDYLQSGDVIAWYQGGAEYGPRALGHRSFLADPSVKDMLDSLNRIKGREAWRPLAPIVPAELFEEVFGDANCDMCEFMLRTLKIKEEWRDRLSAVCHVDGSTRPQILHRESNPELYELLMSYFKATGIPCLVNTSLNINGFPIVETPSDLCDLGEELCFMSDITNVRIMFVDNHDFYELHPKRPKILF